MIKAQCIFFLCLLISVFMLSGCDSIPCEDSDGVQVNMGFYRVEGNAYLDASFPKLKVYPLDNMAEPLSNVLSADAKDLYLPLSKNSDTTIYVFKFDSISFDTIHLYYTKELRLESHECGFDFFFELTGAETTTHKVDSVWIRKPTVGYGIEENIKIFF